ncbi:MAG: signal peptidase I [Flavobacteriaceae bacterium]|nr:signal peptidase I [Flavobacteriaceae bacterium]
MTFLEWLGFFLVLQLVHFGGTWKLYRAAGESPWKALVPIYNAVILMKIINRPKWWVILLFIPTINIIMFAVLWIETARSFGKNSTKDTFLVLISLGFYLYWINYASSIHYVSDRSLKSRTTLGETISSIAFAIVAATIVHNYFIQPFIIPTGSLEKSLLIGDFLFVSKFHYGARAPMTAVSFPMVHDTIPLLKVRSYLKKPQIPYFRFPGFEKIKRNEIVVFSWPADTVRQFFVKEKGVRKPIDKKSNYVKRCVGLPGDSLEIINGFVHTNGKRNQLPDRAKVQYTFLAYNTKGVSARQLASLGYRDFFRKYRIENITQTSYQKLLPYIVGSSGNSPENFVAITDHKGLSLEVIQKLGLRAGEQLQKQINLTLTLEEAQKLKNVPWLDSIKQQIDIIQKPNERFFPNRLPYNWNQDNFGPIVIPKKGSTVQLTKKNIPLYKKIITDYEKNQLEILPNQILINGQQSSSYTFKKDYYWMMGDNRHRSEDSRFWGFVPDDHIVGKPIFIWFSIDGINDGLKNWKVRWDRVFTMVNGEGKPTSFLPHFLIVLALWQIFVFFKKRKAKKNEK